MKTIPTKSFGDLKPKKEKKDESEEAYKRTELNVLDGLTELLIPIRPLTKSAAYIPKTERLLAIYDMLTNITFPRKGKGKSTKPKILDAIVMAATDLKLKLQGAYDD